MSKSSPPPPSPSGGGRPSLHPPRPYAAVVGTFVAWARAGEIPGADASAEAAQIAKYRAERLEERRHLLGLSLAGRAREHRRAFWLEVLDRIDDKCDAGLAANDVEREHHVGPRLAGALAHDELADGRALAPVNVAAVLAFAKEAEADVVVAVPAAHRGIAAGVATGGGRGQLQRIDRGVLQRSRRLD